ncbi:MAG TPA: hypothetical protein VFX12_12780 [Vicinamibacterales bacterium]|nr:hypothetical protein [Vicinamibacterales bacterium]
MRRAAAIALVLACATGCSDLRVQIGIYATMQEARSEGAVKNGWVPDGLPAESTDLREGHTSDGRWGTFSFPPAKSDAVKALVDSSEMQANPPACDPPGRLEFWPRLLRTPIDLAQLHATGFHLYRSRDGAFHYAVNWLQGKGYYWRQ